MSRLLRGLIALVLAGAVQCAGAAPPLVLLGTVVTPSRVIPQGAVTVRGERIIAVSADPAAPEGAVTIATDALIFPGLIDLHDHIAWNVLPRWSPLTRYQNRYGWRRDATYESLIRRPAVRLQDERPCDTATYGEVRAVAGGVTTIAAFVPEPCRANLIRNLDEPDDRDRFQHVVDPDALSNARRGAIRHAIEDQRVDVLFVHAAEGRAGDRRSREEFDRLVADGLVGPRTVILQGTALGREGLRLLKDTGASLVWTPRSNETLYGETTDIVAALDLDIPVALGTDWAITGSGNLLEELGYAAALGHSALDDRLTDRQLVDMVTRTPARMVRRSEDLGVLQPGAYADLLVIRGNRARPYHALVRADVTDVRLVLVNGRAVYGEPQLLERLGGDVADAVDVCGASKAIHLAPGASPFRFARPSFAALTRRLREGLRDAGSRLGLAGVAECPGAGSR